MRLPTFGQLKDGQISFVNVTAPYDGDGYGTVVSTVASGLWAKIEPLGGDKDAQTMQVQSCVQAYRIWIRYRATGLTPFQEIRWGSRKFIITGPLEEFEKRFTLIHAEERTSRSL